MSQTHAYSPSESKLLTFHDAVPGFLDGKDSPRAYLERCLETIERREKTVKAWVSLNVEGARQSADAATQRYRSRRPLSQIDGMPIGVKDLFMTRDMPTKMGSPLFENNFTRQDSASVQALREAGAVVLGKTVTTELGMSHPGPTTNPFSDRHTPGGSSSGSAAAVGAQMVPAAIGSQVVGSVIRPAGFCANYALKPTLGAIHRGERLAFSQSHVGVHAGSLVDMWSVSIEMAKRAGGDPGHIGLVGSDAIHKPIRPERLIIIEAEGWAHVEGDTKVAFENAIARLRAAGVEIIDRRRSPMVEAFEASISDSLALCRDVCAYELRWTLQNLIEQHKTGLSESLLSRYEIGKRMSVEDYRLVLLRREAAKQALSALAPVGDAMICLSSVGPAPAMDNAGSDSGVSHTTGLPAFNAWTSLVGAPAITLPLLAVNQLPVGIQLVGQPNTDHRLSGLSAWVTGAILDGRV